MSYRSNLFTAAFISALAQSRITLALLIEIELQTVTSGGDFLRLWTGFGDLSWNSVTWSGTGLALSVDGYKESSDGSPQGLSISLSGADSSVISISLQSLERAKPVNVYIALFDSNGDIIADPYLLFKGFVDETTALYEDGNAVITLNTETRVLDSKRSSNRKLTHQDQKEYFPTDVGLEYAVQLKGFKGQWGSVNAITWPAPIIPGVNSDYGTYQGTGNNYGTYTDAGEAG